MTIDEDLPTSSFSLIFSDDVYCRNLVPPGQPPLQGFIRPKGDLSEFLLNLTKEYIGLLYNVKMHMLKLEAVRPVKPL
jgi:hypothetical protein